MRHLFLEREMITAKQVAHSLLDDYAVLVQTHYAFIDTAHQVNTDGQTGTLLEGLPSRVKQLLSSSSPENLGTSHTLSGYSCSGRVLASGKRATQFRPGDLVACNGRGYVHHADLVCAPAHLVSRINHVEHLKSASIVMPGSLALEAIRRARPQIADRVCVIGLGVVGHLLCQLARNAGCYVIGIDDSPHQLAHAKKSGANTLLHATNDNVLREINFLTDNHGVDITFIAPHTHCPILHKVGKITRRKGRIVVVGEQEMIEGLEWPAHKELNLMLSPHCGAGHGDTSYERGEHDYPYAHVRWTEGRNMQAIVELIEQKKINTDALIAQEVTLEQSQETWQAAWSENPLGVVVRYNPEDKEKDQIKLSREEHKQGTSFIPALTDTIRIGIIGAENITAQRAAARLNTMAKVKVTAITASTSHSCEKIPKKAFQDACAYSSETQMLEDDVTDVILITSPQSFRCNQILEALHARKAVLVDRPMITSYADLQELFLFLDAYPRAPFCVAYPRTFSPFMQKIKKTIALRKTPIIANYRVCLSGTHYTPSRRNQNGAGTIISDACHVINLFMFLTDATPTAVSVEALHAPRVSIFPTENFSAQISFDDGSVCSMLYTTLGHEDGGTERMELFFEDKTIVMKDYVSLYGFGLSSLFNEAIPSADRGHAGLFHAFFQGLKQGDDYQPLIDFSRLKLVSEVTLAIDQLVCEGGGVKQLNHAQ